MGADGVEMEDVTTDTLSLLIAGGDGDTETAHARLFPGDWITISEARDRYVWKSAVLHPSLVPTFYWSYVDRMGHEVGPVRGDQMFEWDKECYFPNTTPVRVWAQGWVPVRRLYGLGGNNGVVKNVENAWELVQ